MLVITKFNKMIRNKIIWAILAVIISVSFVMVGFASKGCSGEPQSRSGLGSLYGEDVSAQEFNMARFFAMGMRDSRALSEDEADALRDQAWKRLAALKTAERMGLVASDSEIADVLRQDPTFAVNGQFNPQRYGDVLRSQLRVTPDVFEEYLRQHLVLTKLMGAMEAQTWVSPGELDERLSQFTDRITVEYALLADDAYQPEVSLAETNLVAFFEENRERFTIPPLCAVRYVRVPISNYLAQAEVSEDDIQDYYDRHLAEYQFSATNGTNVTTEFTPLEDVASTITSALRKREASYLAEELATDFVATLMPDRDGTSRPFDEVAQAKGLPIATSDFFTAYESLAELQVGLEFNRSAFELDAADPEAYFSDPVTGSNFVYVIAAHSNRASRLPDLAEVREDVVPLATEALAQSRLLSRVEATRDDLAGAVTGGQAFAEAVLATDLSVNTTGVFTVYDSFSAEVPHGDVIVPGVMTLMQGELSDPLRTTNGYVIAYLKTREPGELGATEFLRPQMSSGVVRRRSGLLFGEWSAALLKKAEFEDYATELEAGGVDDGDATEDDDDATS